LLAYINSLTGQLKISENSSGSWVSSVVASGVGADSSTAVSVLNAEVHLFVLNSVNGTISEYTRSAGKWSAPTTVASGARGKIASAVRAGQILVSFYDAAQKNLNLARKAGS